MVKLWVTAMNPPVLVSLVVTLGRWRVFFWAAIILSSPAFVQLVASHVGCGSDYLTWAWRVSDGVFAMPLVHLWVWTTCGVYPKPPCNWPAASSDGEGTPDRRSRVASERRQETLINSNLVTLFRLSTELIGPL